MKRKSLNFNEIIGQKLPLKYLNFFIRNPTKSPTLFIFYGPSGVGKVSIAETFSMQLLCHSPQLKNLNGCDCVSCNLFRQEQHPDYIFFPNNKPILIGDEKKPEDFTIRWLIQSRLNFKPHLKKMRIVIFPNTSLITTEAETAMLKNLEEPPSNTKFIFITENLINLKNTIQSRGIKIKFSYLTTQNIQNLCQNLQKEYYPFQGGSLEKTPIPNELVQQIQTMIKSSIQSHTLMLKMENWLNDISKNCETKYLISYREFLNYFSLILLYEIYISSDNQKFKKIKKIFSLKKKINSPILGLEPYLLSYLFYQLNID